MPPMDVKMTYNGFKLGFSIIIPDKVIRAISRCYRSCNNSIKILDYGQ